MIDLAEIFAPRIEEVAHAALTDRQRDSLARSEIVNAMADDAWLQAQERRLNASHLAVLELLADDEMTREQEAQAIAFEYLARRELWFVREEMARRAGRRGFLN